MHLQQLKTIAIRIALGGGVATFVAINTIPYILSEKIRKSDHYKQAMELLRKHPEAIKYLGEPITEGRVNCTKEENYGADKERMWFRVPVLGPKGQGKLYYDITRKENDNKPSELLNVELTLKDLKNYKLLIKRAN